MDLGIRGKRALVTGTGLGIGFGIAKALAKEGARVAVVSRNQDSLDKLMKEMGGTEAGHFSIAQDLTDLDGPKNVMSELNANFGKLDILINNLGSTLDITDPLCSLEDWRRIYRMNFEVTVEFSNFVLPYMRARGWGRIVNISSTAGMENNGPVTYCSMKAALVAYTRSMGRVLAKDGVVMSSILPGAVFTEGGFWDKALIDRPEHVEKYLTDRLPLDRFGKIDDIGHMAAFLSSDLADFCQGSIIPVDGGQSRHYFAQ